MFSLVGFKGIIFMNCSEGFGGHPRESLGFRVYAFLWG